MKLSIFYIKKNTENQHPNVSLFQRGIGLIYSVWCGVIALTNCQRWCPVCVFGDSEHSIFAIGDDSGVNYAG